MRKLIKWLKRLLSIKQYERPKPISETSLRIGYVPRSPLTPKRYLNSAENKYELAVVKIFSRSDHLKHHNYFEYDFGFSIIVPERTVGIINLNDNSSTRHLLPGEREVKIEVEYGKTYPTHKIGDAIGVLYFIPMRETVLELLDE